MSVLAGRRFPMADIILGSEAILFSAVSDWEVNEDTALAMEAILASPVLAVFASEETRKMLSIRITHMNSGKAPAKRKLRNRDR